MTVMSFSMFTAVSVFKMLIVGKSPRYHLWLILSKTSLRLDQRQAIPVPGMSTINVRQLIIFDLSVGTFNYTSVNITISIVSVNFSQDVQ